MGAGDNTKAIDVFGKSQANKLRAPGFSVDASPLLNFCFSAKIDEKVLHSSVGAM